MEARSSGGELPHDEVGSPAARATSGASVARAGVWSAATNVVPQLYTLVISVAGARFLGPEGLGRQSFIAFVIASANNVFAFGLQIALMRSISESVGAGRTAEARGLLPWAQRISVVGAFIAATTLLIAAFSGAEPRTAWVLAAATTAFGVATAMPGAALQGLQRWRDISVVVLTCGAGSAVATVAVLAAGGGVTSMIAVQLFTAAAIGVAVTVIAVRRLRALAPRAVRPSPGVRHKTLRYAGAAFAGSLVTLIVFRRSEFFFLQHWWNDREIALYSVAFSAATTLVLIPQALATVLAPAVATLLGAGQHDRIRTGYGRSLRLLLIASLPVAAGALALAPETVRLVFGSGFAASKGPLLVLLAPFPLIPLMTVSYALVVGLGNVRFPLIVGVGSAALNIVLDAALIPGHAALGAAIANSGAQAATAIGALLYAMRLVAPVRLEWPSIGSGALCSLLGGAAAWAVLEVVGGAPGVVAGLVVGVLAYVATALRFRILPRDDARWIDETFGSLIGGRVGAVARLLATR